MTKMSKYQIKNKRLYDTYGITLDEWNNLFIKQGGRCAICDEVPKSGILCVDHRHVPKYKKMTAEEKREEVRGLVDFRCNRYLIGPVERYFKNPRKAIERLVKYFETYKCKGDE